MSGPGTASPPAPFVFPAGHAVQTFEDTYWFTAHTHVVSAPDAAFPAAFVEPPGHAVQTFEATY